MMSGLVNTGNWGRVYPEQGENQRPVVLAVNFDTPLLRSDRYSSGHHPLVNAAKNMESVVCPSGQDQA
jgi:hypothetical protein